MNIVYGVSGEGLGHVFEAREVFAQLKDDGHNVKLMTYGDRACRSLADFQPVRIEGIELCFGAKGLSLWKTLRKNLRFFWFYLTNTRRLLRELSDFRPDVFITAYEPFTTLASHWLHKPLISMDNQNDLRFLSRPRGTALFPYYLARWTTYVVTYGAANYIIKSLNRREITASGVHLVAPIIQADIRQIRPTTGSHVLVYLTKPNPDLIEVLKSMGERFVVYCNNRVGEDQNISYRAQGPGFLRDLGDCKAIIGTTGFSLIADSIYLKKPYFGVPLRKQFEQTHNAHFLQGSGLGEFSEIVSREQLESFFAKLPDYREKLGKYDLDPAEQMATLRELLAEFGSKSVADPVVGVTASFRET